MPPNMPPKPKELANQAKPKPAAKPPSIAPHGFLGATAGAAAGAAAGLAAAAFVAFCAGAAGVALFCVTLLDCLPIDPPPPMRRAASAFKPEKASAQTKIVVQSFMFSPEKTYELNEKFPKNLLFSTCN
jgi:predicted lipid-binding transport protein (Tim44 family)